LINSSISVWKKIVRKNQIAKKGQKGICEFKWVALFLLECFIFQKAIKDNHIILHVKYVSIIQGKAKLVQSTNQIIRAILKSHPHIHAHHDTTI